MTKLVRFIALLGALGVLSGPLDAVASGRAGSFTRWSAIELDFVGPTSESAGDPNPFDIVLDVSFVGPSGQTFVVPGFFDGDGAGGPDGDLWRVRFSADESGAWSYSTASAEPGLDGVTGRFVVTDPPPEAAAFYRWGRLEAVGTATDAVRYLKFRDGPYWMKAGSDDPENFLGGFADYDTVAERLAAIDYLASKGINSLYVMTHNVDGDEEDVWPWLGATQSEAKTNGRAGNVRFDVAKLAEWRQVFEHMQEAGVATYLVLEDDSAWTGHDRERYYREMIARFGDLPVVLFNICEEYSERYDLDEAIGFAESLAAIDPYDHPIAIHDVREGDSAKGEMYLDAEVLDFTSIKTSDQGIGSLNNIAGGWIEEAIAREVRVPMVNFDEARPEEDRKAWWAAYLGGGVWEAHPFGPWDRPLDTWDAVWTQLGGTRTFMESLPFWRTAPCNDSIVAGSGFCLGEPGEVYALYLDTGGTIDLDLPADELYLYRWWDPANGHDDSFSGGDALDGGVVSLTAPGAGDWAALVENAQSSSIELSISGSCPGEVTIELSGGVGGAEVVLAHAPATGLDFIPAGDCAGLPIALVGAATLGRRELDPAGGLSRTREAAEGVCGRAVQAIDLARCERSNVAFLPSG